MKAFFTSALIFISLLTYGQKLTTIRVSVPKPTDEVYIVGNQDALGNWIPDKVRMAKTSDYEREISLNLSFPAEFKFTRGNWQSEAVITKLHQQDNLIIHENNSQSLYYKIQGWTDSIEKFATYSEFDIKSIKSTILNQDRKIYVALPENYSPKIKYPVVYVTDANNLHNFEISFQTVRQQSQYNVFPRCILVGIYQLNRNEEIRFNSESGRKFKDFIFNELIPYIDRQYSTADFKAIIGHSDGAEYNHYLMFDQNNPFDAFINISEDIKITLDGYQESEQVLEKFKDFIHYNNKEISYFVASGNFDFWHRVEAGQKIDSVFKQLKPTNINFQHKVFNAEHNELFAKSIQVGLTFIFQSYRNFEAFVASLNSNNFNYEFSKNNFIKKNRLFDPDYELTDEDFSIIEDLIASKKNYHYYDQFLKTENADFQRIPRLSIARQYYFLGEYEKSLKLFNEIIDMNDKASLSYFLPNFKPVLDIYIGKNKNPKGAIQYLNRCKAVMPQDILVFSYFVAKVGIEHRIEKKVSKSNLQFCEQNFNENKYFTRTDLATLKQKLR